ncbi:uncharacterized protein LOC129302663 [Prosopis cineraria]|uniref:uncharacterized protein LOC129302663 n=1 Tax=Prosopis cineraria TaxID=364024 RepID=UPI00240ECC53|nr:uncharacterized protein LOC129302663 [Prosopis cineraria]
MSVFAMNPLLSRTEVASSSTPLLLQWSSFHAMLDRHGQAFKKSQVVVLIILAFLLLITHLLPSSIRPAFLYFIFNFLIISLGAEAGLLSFSSASSSSSSSSSKPSSLHTKTTSFSASSSLTQKPVIMAHEAIIPEVKEQATSVSSEHNNEKKAILARVKKPSLFFIACEETEAEEAKNDHDELCDKAEAFIRNFYKQLKMQREESWKKIHEFHQKAF